MVLTALLPLGLSIPAGVQVSVDDGPEMALTLERCLRAGCVAGRVLSAEDIATLRRGTVLAIRFDAAPGRTVDLEGSLSGISAGLDATGWSS
jgi:invasion protein IalB